MNAGERKQRGRNEEERAYALLQCFPKAPNALPVLSIFAVAHIMRGREKKDE
jgi:hypothetical protein